LEVPLKLKKTLEKLLEEKAPGPFPSFAIYHVIKALELIAKEPVGRGRISKQLSIGEGATRTLISRLKEAGLILISKKGCSLTAKGTRLWKEIASIFVQKAHLERNELVLTKCNTAVQLKNLGNKVRTGLEQRDAALMAGAKGATTLVFRRGKLVMPNMSEDISHDFPIAFRQLKSFSDLKENDVVVISSADSLDKAEYGAYAAAWTLIENSDD
jgi:predicted transcriptional regulator